MKATPGCQVLVAKDGKVIYHKSFGYHTYENTRPVVNSDLYDVASITKICATLPSLMRLVDLKKFDVDKTLGYYLPQMLDSSNKKDLIVREVLAHQARLKPWIPYWLKTMENGKYKPEIYSKVKTPNFPYRVADSLYIQKDYPAVIYARNTDSPLEPKKQYLYSDIGYYYFKLIIENITHMPMENYVRNFYSQLGMYSSGYRPLEHFPKDRIVPTENDKTFRHQLLQGDVHDQGAAMLGGVCGHAGVFSNANDLAKLMQMYLNKGTYGGLRFISEETIAEFTKCQFQNEGNRRALGFDKPEFDTNKESPTSRCVSMLSYGHSGFTGTYTWVDPMHNLVYIFLSNRIHPDMDNKKLTSMSVRTRILDVVYDAIEAGVK
jgi:beta-N-acetylhexosaminidase